MSDNRYPFDLHGASCPVYLECDLKGRPPVVIVLKGPGMSDMEYPYVRVVG